MSQGTDTTRRIGLALSGGGIRAAVFHLGVFHRLADEGLLEAVSAISTVSGGSLVTAAVLSNGGMRWPTSRDYLSSTYPELRRLLTTVDLFSVRAIGWAGLLRFNRRILRDRAGILADLLASRWGIAGRLSELPDSPWWWINATCLDTGKNWRFSKREMGDWQFGRHYDPPFRLAEAAAASAAVPYAIGALSLNLPTKGWYRIGPATRRPVEKREPPATTVRLWDGGAYENLGLEALYKPGQGTTACDFLICSDASGPLQPPRGRRLRALAKGQLATPCLFDVSSDQIRSLRSRMLLRDIESGTVEGVLLRMGNSVRDIDLKSGRSRETRHYDGYLSDESTAHALLHPTDLSALSTDVFDTIARHGYEVADATLTAHARAAFPQSFDWNPP
jgi:NTE family protein